IVPGFTDAQVHFVGWSLAQREVCLEGTRSLGEALERVREALGSVQRGGWLRGRGWRSGDWEPSVEPTRQVLDAVTGDVPTALSARDGHSLWLNSAALAAADGDLRAAGGVVEVDASGEPTGVLREDSAWHFRETYVETTYTETECLDAVRTGLRLASLRGVTAIHAAVTNEDHRLGGLPFFERLDAEDALTLRVWNWIPHELDAFEAAREIWQPLGLRQRIEHAQLLALEDVERFAQLGVAASVQFVHATSDRDLADRNWAGMTDRAYTYRSLLDAGAVLANGSDAPVEELDPLTGIRAGVLRTQDEREASHPEQA